MSYPPKSKKQKLPISWAVGAIAVALLLLIIGRFTSEEIRDNNNVPDSQEIGVDEIQINQNGEVIELYSDEVEATTGATVPDRNDTIVE